MDEKFDGSIDRHYTNYDNNMCTVNVIFYIKCVHIYNRCRATSYDDMIESMRS